MKNRIRIRKRMIFIVLAAALLASLVVPATADGVEDLKIALVGRYDSAVIPDDVYQADRFGGVEKDGMTFDVDFITGEQGSYSDWSFTLAYDPSVLTPIGFDEVVESEYTLDSELGTNWNQGINYGTPVDDGFRSSGTLYSAAAVSPADAAVACLKFEYVIPQNSLVKFSKENTEFTFSFAFNKGKTREHLTKDSIGLLQDVSAFYDLGDRCTLCVSDNSDFYMYGCVNPDDDNASLANFSIDYVNYLRGDINQDGRVDLFDEQALANHINGIQTLTGIDDYWTDVVDANDSKEPAETLKTNLTALGLDRIAIRNYDLGLGMQSAS